MKNLLTHSILTSMCALILATGTIQPAAAKPSRVRQLSTAGSKFFKALARAPYCVTRSKKCPPRARAILITTAAALLLLLAGETARRKEWFKGRTSTPQADKPTPGARESVLEEGFVEETTEEKDDPYGLKAWTQKESARRTATPTLKEQMFGRQRSQSNEW